MKTSEEACCPFVATTTAATTTAAATTVEATTTIAAEDIIEIITPTPAPTVPTPTVSPTKKQTIGPTTRDQLFGNVLPTPANEPDENSPTPAPAPKPKAPTDEPTNTNTRPTYTPTWNELAGQGRKPPAADEPQFVLPGDTAGAKGAPSAGVSADFRLGCAVILVSGVCSFLFA